MAFEINNSNYEELMNSSEKALVIDFWAEWCGPCRKVGPIIDELYEENKDKNVVIGKCDVDANDEVTALFKVRNIPTIVFIKNGEVIDKVIGAASKAVLQEKINALL